RGIDGRLCLLAHPRSAWRADDQAHLRSGVPHRTAPEGPKPRALGRAGAEPVPAEHRNDTGIVQRRRGARRQGVGPFRAGARAGTPRRASGGERVAPAIAAAVSACAFWRGERRPATPTLYPPLVAYYR